MHIFVETFSVFGAQVQYWMPIAVVIVVIAIVVGVRK